MDKLLLGLSLLCLTWTMSGKLCIKCRKKPQLNPADKVLKCRTCQFMHPNHSCAIGGGICTAKQNETCLTMKFFFKGALTYAKMMCKKNCVLQTIQRHEEIRVYECCEGRNFCNNI